jgi:hypothetical protein
MSKLSFRLAFKTSEFQNLDLPVEVRKPNLALVAKTLATKTVDVQPGTYFVSATMPAGQELYTQVIVGDTDALATLEPEQESPHESHEQTFFMSTGLFAHSRLGLASDEHEVEALGSVEATMGLLRGADPRTAVRVQIPFIYFEKVGAGVQFRIAGSAPDSPQQLEFLRPRKPPLHVAMPVSSGQTGLVVVRRLATGNSDLVVDVHVANGEADLLLSGLSAGYLREASEALSSDQISAEKLLYAKEADPFGAAVGAYALLQFGELDRLHNWTENLMNLFQWLPDGPPIRGEHLARMGRHQEAIEAFVQMPLRGIPQFSIGISYALNRLRVYTRPSRNDFPAEFLNQAQQTLDYLEQVAGFVDFRRPTLTTRGLRTDAEFPAGVDIGRYL